MALETIVLVAGALAVLFGLTMTLFRVEMEMPTTLSGILSFVVVFVGVMIAGALQAAGVVTFL